jgi:hypothetical protein
MASVVPFPASPIGSFQSRRMFQAGRESRGLPGNPPRPSLHSKCAARGSAQVHRTARPPARPIHCPLYLSTQVRPRGFTRVGQFRANDLQCVGWRRGRCGGRASGIGKSDMPAKMRHERDRHHLAGRDSPPLFAGEASKVTNRPDADYRNIPTIEPFAGYRGVGDILRIQTARPDDALR